MLYRPRFVKHSRLVRDESLRDWRAAERNAIVVALDGNAAAEKALPYAVQLARRWEAPLHLVQVTTPGHWDGHESAMLVNSEWLSVREQAEAYLEGVAEAIAAANDIPVTAEITANISAESGLSSLCDDVAHLLIVAKPPRSSFSQFYFGSTTNSLVGRLTVPLLIVPTGWSDNGLDKTDYQRILVSVGHGDVSESVLNAAAAFAADGGSCHLLHVVPLRAEVATARIARFLPINLRQDAWVRMHRAETWLQRQKVDAVSQLVNDWQYSPAKAILAHGNSLGADLIVIGTPRRVLPWWLRGGVPEYIARHSTRPVLLVPTDASVPILQRGDHVDIHSN